MVYLYNAIVYVHIDTHLTCTLPFHLTCIVYIHIYIKGKVWYLFHNFHLTLAGATAHHMLFIVRNAWKLERLLKQRKTKILIYFLFFFSNDGREQVSKAVDQNRTALIEHGEIVELVSFI